MAQKKRERCSRFVSAILLLVTTHFRKVYHHAVHILSQVALWAMGTRNRAVVMYSFATEPPLSIGWELKM